ncbi:MAG: hypothetical protein AAF556_00245 [Pseudomonadota bacterium]
MTSGSDKSSGDGKPANKSEADFDEFDDFDDFDDFDEAAGLDAFEDSDDPFEDGSESDIDDLDAAAAELDAYADASDDPAADPTDEPTDDPTDNPPADIPEDVAPDVDAEAAADPIDPADEPATDLDHAGDEASETTREFDADDFAASEFEDDGLGGQLDPIEATGSEAAADDTAEESPTTNMAPTADMEAGPDAAEPSDDADLNEDANSDFDDFEADDFTPADEDSPAVSSEEPPALDDAAELETAEPAATDSADDVPEADNDLDALLQAKASPADDPFAPAAADDTSDTAVDTDTATEVDAGIDTTDLDPDPVDEDEAFLAGGDDTAAATDGSSTDGASTDGAPAGTADATPEEPEEPEQPVSLDDDSDNDLMPAAGNVAGLSGDGEMTQSDPAATLAEEPTMAVGDDESASAEPLADPETEPAEAHWPDSGPDSPVEPTDDGNEAEIAVAAAVSAAEATDDEASDMASEESEAEQAPTPSPRPPKRKSRGPNIPLIDVGDEGFDKLADAYPKRLRAVQALANRKLRPSGLKLAEKICRGWSSKATVPYRTELDRINVALDGEPGTFVINLAFEMGCTTGMAEDPEGGQRLLHTLDWSLDGLGRMLVAARRHSDAGLWVNFTWPGYIGCLQGIAPGRFAAAINHAPINGSGPKPLAWAMSKMKWYGQKGMPPAFLLRRVFDECEDFDAAVSMIEKTPLCYPAIFSVLGLQDGEFSIIERTENAKSTQKRAPAVTNHWLNNEFKGTVTAYQSPERLVAMKSRMAKGVDETNWLVHPILNADTRLSVDLNPTTGRMRVRTYNGVQPTSSFLDIYAD